MAYGLQINGGSLILASTGYCCLFPIIRNLNGFGGFKLAFQPQETFKGPQRTVYYASVNKANIACSLGQALQ
jgi:hypothetical protein